MQDQKWSRRQVLQASTMLTAGLVFAEPLRAAPSPSEVTPALIEAAGREGKVSFYTALELNVAERLAGGHLILGLVRTLGRRHQHRGDAGSVVIHLGHLRIGPVVVPVRAQHRLGRATLEGVVSHFGAR